MSRVWARWLPAAVASVVIGAGAYAANAAPDADLPDKTAEEVLALVAAHDVQSFSGTVEQSSNLGLPELPATGPSADADLASALEFLTGSHEVRVFVDGDDKARVQVLDRLAERDVVVNGSDVWLYDSSDATAVHVTAPEHAASDDRGHAYTPSDLADRVLEHISPSTEVTVGDDTRVAGRTAYHLVLSPRTDQTLVDSIAIAVDSETGMPLAVTVRARGQDDPAVQVAFTSLTLETPAQELFSFAPPDGTDVTEHAVPHKTGTPGDHPEPLVTGSDWTAVVELPAGSVPAEMLATPVWGELTTSVSGGRLLSTSLLTVLVTDDGRVFAGAVPAEVLQAAAAG